MSGSPCSRPSARPRGRALDPMDVAVARNLDVAPTPTRRSAALARQARVDDRMIERSRGPDGSTRSHVMAYADQAGATEAAALFGPPRRSSRALQALQAVGVRYVLDQRRRSQAEHAAFRRRG